MPSKMQIILTACVVLSGTLPASMEAVAAGTRAAKRSKAADVDPRGQVLAFSCAGCHGTDGKSVGIIPGFYGKSPEYLEAALKDFKSGARFSSIMGRHAKGYSDEEIHQIAEYFGTVWTKNK
ncbi:MAG: sulfide dehydrogenase [Chlorobiaceae bacterium]|nr:sulfide dehydrogenase [Chlorobiaceae bacterium]